MKNEAVLKTVKFFALAAVGSAAAVTLIGYFPNVATMLLMLTTLGMLAKMTYDAQVDKLNR
jgi:hypothetical protein